MGRTVLGVERRGCELIGLCSTRIVPLLLLCAMGASACGKTDRPTAPAMGGSAMTQGGASGTEAAGATSDSGRHGGTPEQGPVSCNTPAAEWCQGDESDPERLSSVPTSRFAFAVNEERVVYGLCEGVLVQDGDGCPKRLATSGKQILDVAIVDDGYLLREPARLTILTESGENAGVFEANAAEIGPLASGPSQVAFFLERTLFRWSPPAWITAELAMAEHEVGKLVLIDSAYYWTEGARTTGDVDVLVPEVVKVYDGASPRLEAELPCFDLATDGTRLYCDTTEELVRWRPGEADSLETLATGTSHGLLVGETHFVRGRDVHSLDGLGVVLSLPSGARPLAVAGGAVYWVEADNAPGPYLVRRARP
jgi:hypothetical protein